MNARSNLPTKKAILKHWSAILWDPPETVDTCWSCGLPGLIERAHLQARCDGGSDEIDNLILLCRACHWQQETIIDHHAFREALIDGAPFMSARLAYLRAKMPFMK